LTRNGATGLLVAVGLALACRGPGRAVPAAGGPRRIVTLAPNLTEIVFALGAGDRLVGVSEYSDHPEAARAIARVGGLEVDPEKVAAMHPDLVLAVAEGNAQGTVRALEAAGLPVTVTPSGSLDAVLESIRIVAGGLGRPEEGRRLVADLERRRAAVRATPSLTTAVSMPTTSACASPVTLSSPETNTTGTPNAPATPALMPNSPTSRPSPMCTAKTRPV